MEQAIFLNTSWKSFDEAEYLKQLSETHYIPVRQHPTEFELRETFPSLDNIAEYGSLDAYSKAVQLWAKANPQPEDKPYSAALLLLAGHVDELLDETVASYADWRQEEVARAKWAGLENCWQPHQIMADRISEKPTEIYDLLRHALAVSKPFPDNTDPKLDVKWFHYEARIKDLTMRLDRYCRDIGLEVPESDFYLALPGKIPSDSAQFEPHPIKQSLDEFLGLRGLSAPLSNYTLDKWRLPHGETARQQKRREEESERDAVEYQARRAEAIGEYRKLVSDGKIVPTTPLEKRIETARGHPDNQSTQAARRRLKKAGYVLSEKGEIVASPQDQQPSLRDTLAANQSKAAEQSAGMPTQNRQKSENALGA